MRTECGLLASEHWNSSLLDAILSSSLRWRSLYQPFRNYRNSQTNIVKSVSSHSRVWNFPGNPVGSVWTTLLHNQQTCSVGNGPEHAFPLLLKGKGGCSHQLLGVSSKTGWEGPLVTSAGERLKISRFTTRIVIPSEYLEDMPHPCGGLWFFFSFAQNCIRCPPWM